LGFGGDDLERKTGVQPPPAVPERPQFQLLSGMYIGIQLLYKSWNGDGLQLLAFREMTRVCRGIEMTYGQQEFFY